MTFPVLLLRREPLAETESAVVILRRGFVRRGLEDIFPCDFAVEIKGKVLVVFLLFRGLRLGLRAAVSGVGSPVLHAGSYAEKLFDLYLFCRRRRRYDKDIIALGAAHLHAVRGYSRVVKTELCRALVALDYHKKPVPSG